jgi:alpha-1,3-rhamnosyltransferase
MSDLPLVSVITPCYNHEKYIRQTIESVVHQTYKNIEYFVIDDGSSDNSAEIIKSLRLKYHFNFEVQQNKGLASSINKLLAGCKGKYIAAVESDDVWALDKIEKQVAFLESHPEFAICGGNALCIDEKGATLLPRYQSLMKYTVYDINDIMSFDYTIFPLTVMMRKEIYDMVGKYDESLLYIDAYTWIKVAVNNLKIVILPDVLGYYRVHESNVHWNSFQMYETLIKTIDEFKVHPLYMRLKKGALYYIFPYLAVKDKKEALRILPKAFRFKFRTFKGIIALLVPYSILRSFSRTRYR